MAVSIAAPVTTRAFEDGDATESAISSAKFFFFNADGSSAYPAITSTDLSWSAVAPADDNVTKKSSALLVFNSGGDQKGYTLPSSMIAILNPSTTVSALSDPTIDNLKEVVESDYKTGANFIMSNSVYMANGVEMMATPIKVENIFKESKDAIEAPVKVYVERLAAKVTAAIGESIINEGTEITVEDATFTVTPELVKWDVVGRNPKSNLMKEIDTKWNFTGFNWNDTTNFRSYWAKSYIPKTGEYYGFNSYSGTKLGFGDEAYCLENAAADTTTQFFVTAKIGRAHV